MEERVAVRGVEAAHFLEGFDGAIDEAAALEIEPETEHHVGVFDAREIPALEQGLVHLDGPRHLPALAVDIAQNQMDFEGVSVDPGGLAELFDGQVDLIGDQEVQTEHVVMRIAGLAAVDPASVAQLVALPGLADRHAGEHGQQDRDEGEIAGQHGQALTRVSPAGARVPRSCAAAASTKLAKSGCGRSGRDRNSGWNCTPRNQG